LHEAGGYDKDGVHAVLDAAMLRHIAYVIDSQPYYPRPTQRDSDSVRVW